MLSFNLNNGHIDFEVLVFFFLFMIPLIIVAFVLSVLNYKYLVNLKSETSGIETNFIKERSDAIKLLVQKKISIL